ncbi:hypothetical protein DMA12_14890 [Amycolatopsis balhimycina DSM 5908]|uniref:Uncharacterized protein n=1 Tax=Amycolatopsis balhimycina DSM 5908 TaxID=1081091 RepID=A0A428WP49_AMYBA|nr:hypothetical protein DMA12_14890 [Amycolatopsis balhimycina DSM 5908]
MLESTSLVLALPDLVVLRPVMMPGVLDRMVQPLPGFGFVGQGGGQPPAQPWIAVSFDQRR